MAYDYSDDVAFALEMISEYGRLVDFHQLSETPVDPDKPLEGNGAPTTIAGVWACFVEPSSLRQLGIRVTREGVWKDSTQIALVAPDGINDLTDFTSITDSDGSTWAIDATDKLRPGETTVLYFIGVKR